MSDIDIQNIRKLDGSLLVVFRELLLRGTATDAAARLGLSQSAVSHSLKRLREIFDDPLFVRRPHGLEPTRRAIELGPKIEALMELATSIIAAEDGFDATTARRQFIVAAPDYIGSMLAPRLVRIFQSKAPGSRFACVPLVVGHALDALRTGSVDLAIGHFSAPLAPEFETELLFEDQYCVVARKKHPRLSGSIDARAYAEIDHVFVGQPDTVHYEPKAAIREQAKSAYGTIPPPERIATVAYVSQWETALLVASSTNAIAECPRRLAEKYAGPLRLQLLDPPYPAETRPVFSVRRKGGPDAGIDWLLDALRGAVGP